MNWQTLVDPVLSGRLCLTLLHSVWQVSLLAGSVWCFDRLWRNQSVELRYIVHVGALAVALLAMPVTYSLIDVAETPTGHAVPEAAHAEPAFETPTQLVIRHAEESELIAVPSAPPEFPVAHAEHQLSEARIPQPSIAQAAVDPICWTTFWLS